MRDWPISLRSSDQSKRGNSKRHEKTRKRTRHESTNSRDAPTDHSLFNHALYTFVAERKIHLFRPIHELTSGKSGGLLLFSSITRTIRSVDEVEQGREEDGGTVDVKSAGKREDKRDEKAWGNCVETDTRPLPSAFPRFPRPFPRAVNHASNFAGLLHPAE